MKTMTCNELGGACDTKFQAETFEEIAEKSKQHGMEMFQKAEPAHMQAMEGMKEKMQDPKAMQEWMDKKKKEFDNLPEDN